MIATDRWANVARHERVADPRYRVVLSASALQRLVLLRRIIERERGDLRRLFHMTRRRSRQVELHLGGHRIDDVVTALEAAGFDVDAVVATSERLTRR